MPCTPNINLKLEVYKSNCAPLEKMLIMLLYRYQKTITISIKHSTFDSRIKYRSCQLIGNITYLLYRNDRSMQICNEISDIFLCGITFSVHGFAPTIGKKTFAINCLHSSLKLFHISNQLVTQQKINNCIF